MRETHRHPTEAEPSPDRVTAAVTDRETTYDPGMTDAPVPLPRRGDPERDGCERDGCEREGFVDAWAVAVPIRGPRAAGGLLLDEPSLGATAPPWLRAPFPSRARLAVVPDPSAVPEPGDEGVVHRPAVLRARPPVVDGPHILGLSRRTRGRWGSRLFALFFVAVYALILGHLVFTLVRG